MENGHSSRVIHGVNPFGVGTITSLLTSGDGIFSRRLPQTAL